MLRNYLLTIIRNIESIYSVLKKSKFNLPIKKIRVQENEECIVIGNGPSLNKIINNIDFFKGKKKICVNEFAHSEHFEKIQPDYYLLMDPGYWGKSPSVNLDILNQKLRNVIRDKVVWPLKIFIPVEGKNCNIFSELEKQNNNIEVYYFNQTSVSCIKALNYYLYKNYLAMPLAQNVLVACIYMALNIGYKNIYLLGADHSWHENIYVDDSNILYWKDVHFYDKSTPKLTPIFKDIEETKRFKMHEILSALSLMFEGYILLDDYSKYLGAKIYNASEKSYIDAFERYRIY